MRKAIALVATVVALLVVAPAPAEAHSSPRRHVAAKVCAKAYHHAHSATAKQCRRQGWWISVDRYPLNSELTKFGTDVLVIGPRGRVYVDTLGQVDLR